MTAWWTVDQARRWIVWRDPEPKLQLEVSPSMDAWKAERPEGRGMHAPWLEPMIREMKEVGRALQQAATGEDGIQVMGRSGPDAPLVRIPEDVFLSPAMAFTREGNCIAADRDYSDYLMPVERPDFQDVVVAREDLERRFPADCFDATLKTLEAHLELQKKSFGPNSGARVGFMFAGDALQLIAWGEVTYPGPQGLHPAAALQRVEAASFRLCDALRNEEIAATGRRGKARAYQVTKPDPDDIPATYFRPGIHINLASWATMRDDNDLADYHLREGHEAPDWGEVTLRAVDVERLRRTPTDGEPAVPYVPAQQVESRLLVNKGGRPPREDWDTFDAELVRQISLDGDAMTRTAFIKRMKVWAAENMEMPPSDTAVERRTKRLIATAPFSDG